MTESQIIYTDAYLTFIDIQGFKEMVLSRYPDKPAVIYEILKEFKRAQYLCPSKWSSWEPEIVNFSDSIVRGVSRKESDSLNDEMIINEIQALRLMQQNLLIWRPSFGEEGYSGDPGIFLRGGLSEGLAYLDQSENMAFGPAMIKAYTLGDIRDTPFRISVDQDMIVEHPHATEALLKDFIIAKDNDACWFIDYFSVNQFSRYGLWIELARLEKVRSILQLQISLHAKDGVLLHKFLWAAQRHNLAVETSKQLNEALKAEGLQLSNWLVEIGSFI